MRLLKPNYYDVIVIGAGAAGLLCAIEAGKRGRKVLLIEHADRVGKKIAISGGGRCNFTNTGTTPENFLSANPHFCKSALARYTPADFISLVEKYRIAYHEKKLGQLFCDGSAQQIIDLLLRECNDAGVKIRCECRVSKNHEGRSFPRRDKPERIR
jgi:predicted Rossmann fold flavoprotein